MKKAIFVVLLLALPVSLLAGCGEEKPSDQQAAPRTMMNSVFTDEGYYYEDNGRLHFFDFTSGQTVCLCSRAGCKHEDTLCDAFVSGPVSFFVWEDKLYYVCGDMSGETSGMKLYRRDLDGTGLYEVGTLCEEFIKEKKVITPNYFAAANGKLYYGAEIENRPGPGEVAFENLDRSVIRSMDLKTGKEETLAEHKEARLIMWAISGEKLLYEEQHIPRNYKDPDFKEQVQASSTFLRQYDLTSGENKLLMEKKIKDGLSYKWIKGSKLYYNRSIYDLRTGEETLLTDEEGLTFINEKYALRYERDEERPGEGWQYIYDLQQKKDLPMEMDGGISIPAKTEDKMVIRVRRSVPGSTTGSSNTYCYVPVEALADGLQESDCKEIYTQYVTSQG